MRFFLISMLQFMEKLSVSGDLCGASILRLATVFFPDLVPLEDGLDCGKKIAADNVTSLKGPQPTMNGRILPYSAEANVKKQLETLGIPIDQLDVVAEPLLPPLGQKA